MNSRKTLESVSVDGLKPTIMLTPVIEQCGEGYRIHHIKSFSIAPDGRDTFVPLRHVSKQKRRILELEDENDKLKRAAERDADVMEALNLSLEESQAENAKLRELVMDMFDESSLTRARFAPMLIDVGVCTAYHITTYYGIEV